MIDYKLNWYTGKARMNKAIHTLQGILLGIKYDEIIDEQEINELRKWAAAHKDLIHKNPLKEFMSIVAEELKNEKFSTEKLEDLFWLYEKYSGDTYYNRVTTDIQILHGICHGILADGVIKDTEVYALNEWLAKHAYLNSYYPYDEISDLILTLLEHPVIDEKAKLKLKSLFMQFVHIEDKKMDQQLKKETHHVSITSLYNRNPELIFKNKKFCITGKLNSIKMEDLIEKIVNLGGLLQQNVSGQTDYLIVGDNGNEAWAFACYGRKVEKAIQLKKSGKQIDIIHECDFLNQGQGTSGK